MVKRESGDKKKAPSSWKRVSLGNLENTMSSNMAEAFSIVGRKSECVKGQG